jgi:hypothetical protein
MPKPVLSTYRILRDKGLNRDINESWVTWAQEMIKAGFESINLYELAGITRPYNQFELIELTDVVLKDLQLDFSDPYVVVRDYVYFIIKSGINNTDNYLSVLREIRDIHYYELGVEYADFYSLYYAKYDLMYSENQWYWPGATRQNIDSIIRERFQTFITECNLKSEKYGRFS